MRQKPAARRKPRPPLNAKHYEIYWMLVWSLDCEGKEEPGGQFRKIDLTEREAASVRRCLRRLAELAGVEERKKPSKNLDDALKAVYLRSRAEAEYDAGPAFRLAERIRKLIAPFKEEVDRRIAERHEREVQRPAREARERRIRIDSLRASLRKLDEEGEAHDESERFRIEREIYGLANSPPADEWPDWIPG
jgi:hypothetical protein